MNYQKPLTKTLSNIELQKDSIKLVIEKPILEKIQFLCQKIHKTEWSGILLYSSKGSIQDPSNMVLIVQDIILMDIGSTAYTSYKYNEKKRNQEGYTDRHIEYVMNNPIAMDWKMGLIHSHHNMATFFSGVDNEELVDNAPSHNYYLSLIVNNSMDFLAKVAVSASSKTTLETPYYASDEEGGKYLVSKKTWEVKKSITLTYDCVIESPLDKNNIEPSWTKSIEDFIEEDKKSKIVTPKKVYPKPLKQSNQVFNTFEEEADDIELFCIQLLAGNNPSAKKFTNLTESLESLEIEIEAFGGSYSTIAESIVEKYVKECKSYFKITNNIIDFLLITEHVIDILEYQEEKFQFLKPVVQQLKELVENLESYDK